MRTTRFVPTLIAACLAATASCSDTATPTSPGRQAAPPASLTTLQGVIHLSATKVNGIVLSMADGEDVILDGPGSASLTNVENADVEVSGQWSGDEFLVADFLVRRVNGADVMDGVVVAMTIQDNGDGNIVGYGLSLTRGSLIPLMDPPPDLIASVGERVWVAETPDGQASAFGIISR